MQDADFIAYRTADPADVHAFEQEEGARPDCEDLKFDLQHSYTFLWNGTIIEILLHDFQEKCKAENWPVQKPDSYVRELLKNHYKKLHMMWFKGQPKLIWDGRLETVEEVEARLLVEMERQAKAS